MVTPDIHWCVRLDLVTGPPEKADDDEIQSLGIGLRCCWIAWSVQSSSLQFSLFGHTLAALLVDSFRRAEVVKLRGLDGLELASFPSLYPLA